MYAGHLMNQTAAAGEQLKEYQQRQRIAAHGAAIRMGRGNPQQFAGQFYQYLTGNPMDSVPVHYTTAESIDAWAIGANQYITDRLTAPAAALAFGGVIGVGVYMNAKVFGGFSPYEFSGQKEAHLAGLRTAQRADTIAFANQFETTAVNVTSLIAGPQAFARSAVGNSALSAVRGYAQRFFGSEANAGGVFAGSVNAGVNLIFNENRNATNTATAFGSGYVMGYAATRIGYADLTIGNQFLLGGGVGLASDATAQFIEKQTDPTFQNYQLGRMLGNVGSTSLGAGLTPIFGNSHTATYANWAVSKIPTMAGGVLKDELFIRYYNATFR